MTREQEILRVLKPYSTVFPNVKMQPEAWPIYARALSSLTAEEVNAAMLSLLHTAKFFPTIGEIFEAAKSVREYADRTKAPTAADAWAEVQRLAKTSHLSEPWVYSCQEVKRAAEAFGRYELCTIEEHAVNIARSQFMKIYNEIVSRQEEDRRNEAVLAALPHKKIVQLAEAKRLREAEK